MQHTSQDKWNGFQNRPVCYSWPGFILIKNSSLVAIYQCTINSLTRGITHWLHLIEIMCSHQSGG